MNARAHIFITGIVQGVFFRSETKREANRLGINGWIRNLANGRVEAVFEGKKEDVEKLIEFCRKGPEASKVDRVDIKWEEPKEEFDGFEIVY